MAPSPVSPVNMTDFLLEHDPEKWIPVFRKDHAPPKIESVMTIQPKAITL